MTVYQYHLIHEQLVPQNVLYTKPFPDFATPIPYQRLADRRTATQKMRGGIIERLGGEIWRQESTAEVRDSANVRIVSARRVGGVLVFCSVHGYGRRCRPPHASRHRTGHDIFLKQAAGILKIPTSEYSTPQSLCQLSTTYRFIFALFLCCSIVDTPCVAS